MKKYFEVKDRVDQVKVNIDYELGGMSYFSGQTSRRGYYAYVGSVRRADGMESFILGDRHSFKQLIQEVNRKSTKAEKNAEEWGEERAKELAEMYANARGWELTGNTI